MYGFSIPVLLQKLFFSEKKEKLKLVVVRVKQSITDVQCAAEKKARVTKEEKLDLKCFGRGEVYISPHP